jgi:hypothetical protein
MNQQEVNRVFGFIRVQLGIKLYPWQKKALEKMLQETAPPTGSMRVVRTSVCGQVIERCRVSGSHHPVCRCQLAMGHDGDCMDPTDGTLHLYNQTGYTLDT